MKTDRISGPPILADLQSLLLRHRTRTAMYDVLLRQAAAPALVLEPGTLRVVAANHSAVALFGFSLEELAAQHMPDLLAEPMGAGAAGPTLNGPVSYRRKDDSLVLMETRARNVGWQDRQVCLVTLSEPPQPEAPPARGDTALDRHLRRAAEMTPGLSLILSLPDFDILSVSNDLLATVNLARADVVGRPLFDVFQDGGTGIGPDGLSLPALRASLRRVAETGETDVLPVQRSILRPAGAEPGNPTGRYWCPVSTPVFADPGAAEFIQLRFDDVTEFVHDRQPRPGRAVTRPAVGAATPNALSRSQPAAPGSQAQKDAWLAGSQRIADIGYWEIDFSTGKITWTDAVYRIYGLDKASFVPTVDSVRLMKHPDDRSDAAAARHRAIAGNALLDTVHRIIRPDGSIRVLKLLGRVTTGRTGPVLSGVVRDITEIQLAEQEAARAARLLESAGRMAKFGGWRMTTADSRILWSKETAALFGRPLVLTPTKDELIGFVAPPYRDQVSDLLSGCAQDGTPFDAVIQIQSGTGETVWVRTVGEADRDAAGGITAIFGAMQVVSDLVEAKLESDILRHRLEQTFEAISECFMIFDADWRITFLNRNAAKFLGQDKDALVGSVVWDSCPSLVGSQFEICCRNAMQSEKPCHFSDLPESADLQIEVEAYPGDQGLSVYFKDVTAEREQERQLHLLREAVSRVNDLVVITGAGTRQDSFRPPILFVNDAYYRKTGFTPEEIIGKTPHILHGAKTQKAVLSRIARALKKSKPVRADIINYTKEGREFWMELDIVPIFDKAGLLTNWVSIQRDISDRKASEEALRLSDERFNLVARATNDVVWDWQIETDVLWWNDRAEGVFGYEGGDVFPGLQRWRAAIHPGDLERFNASLGTALATGASTWLCEYRFKRRSGGYATVLDKGYIARDESGKAVRMVGSVSDITETRRLELGMREAAKIEALGRLTGGIAHDFNNLLTVILGTSDLILETLEDKPNLQRMVETTINAAERGVELTRHLLAFARQQPLDPRPVDVNSVLCNAMPLFRQVVTPGIELKFEPSAHLHYAMIDPGQLVTAVLNLVINSRDALAKGGWIRIGTVNIDAGPEDLTETNLPDADVISGEFVQVSVSDSGHGMSKEVMRQAFEPFFTTKGPSMGSGLGLSMVYGLMKQSKGHARILSRPTKGTTVQLYIPRTVIALADSAASPQGGIALGKGQHILMAEDDPDLSRLVRGELASLGYRVTAVENADKALEVLAQAPDVELLFSDIIMPGTMNGRSLAREARTVYPKLRVLLTSGYAGEASSAQDQAEPEIRILGKPYRVRDLAEAIHTALAGQSDENM